MNNERFHAVANRYPQLRIGVVGDFFLDRYLHIDPAKAETSIETGLPVYNVVEVRSQPGAAGTILNNLVALGIGEIHAVGFCGDDGEGYELRRALEAQPGVSLEHFITSPVRVTPVYCKPLVIEAGRPPRELNRLDTKNWTPTPDDLQRDLADRVTELAKRVDVLLVLDQVELPETGVVTRRVSEAAHAALMENERPARAGRQPPRLAPFPAARLQDECRRAGPDDAIDCHRSRCREEPCRGSGPEHRPAGVRHAGRARDRRRACRPNVPSTCRRTRSAGRSTSSGPAMRSPPTWRPPSPPGPTLREAMELAMAAASIVIHQLGTTGTASVSQIAELHTNHQDHWLLRDLGG